MKNNTPGNPGRTRADYEQQATAWREMLTVEAAKPRGEQSFPESVDDWVGVVATATCHTSGCPAEGRPDTRRFVENIGGVQAVCGFCKQPPRLIALFDDGEHEIPNAYSAVAARPAPEETDVSSEVPGGR